MSGSMQEKDPVKDLIMGIVLFLIIFTLISLWYSSHHTEVSRIILRISQIILVPFAFLPNWLGGHKAIRAIHKIQILDPSLLRFKDIIYVINFVGAFLRWIIIPFILGCIVWLFLSKRCASDYYINSYSYLDLLQNNVKQFPCLAPVVYREKNILDEPLDSGLWRTARKPIQWVAENKILIYKKTGKPVPAKKLINKHGLPDTFSPILSAKETVTLNKSLALKLFEKQLGDIFKGTSKLPDYQQGLAAAFLAFGHGNKDDAKKLLDQMSLSFKEPEKENGPFEIDVTGASEICKKYEKSQEKAYLYFTKFHRHFVNVWFMSLLEFAREKGILASSEFIWLRPADRCLWYSLNQTGGKTAWIEAVGPWTQYKVELKMQKSNIMVEHPELSLAIEGLENSLYNDGWLENPKGNNKNILLNE